MRIFLSRRCPSPIPLPAAAAALAWMILGEGLSSVASRNDLHQLGDLAPLLGLIARRDRLFDAMGGVIGEDFLFGAAQRRAHRRKLRDDVDAIAVVLDHAREPTNLALDPLQPFQHRCLGNCLHAVYIPLPGIGFKGLSWSIPI